MKGAGGVIGLTENPTALNRWMICGPKITKLIGQFESEFNVNEAEKAHLHGSSQKLFKKQTQAFVDTITEFGNPFLDDCPELLVLHSRDCADDTVIATDDLLQSNNISINTAKMS